MPEPTLEESYSSCQRGRVDYKLEIHDEHPSVCLIPWTNVNPKWRGLLMKLNGYHGGVRPPNLEIFAILGLVCYFCGDENYLGWARRIREVARSGESDYNFQAVDVLGVDAGEALLDEFDFPANFGIWRRGTNSAVLEDGLIYFTSQPVLSIQCVLN